MTRFEAGEIKEKLEQNEFSFAHLSKEERAALHNECCDLLAETRATVTLTEEATIPQVPLYTQAYKDQAEAEISRLSRLCHDYMSMYNKKDATIHMWEENKKITDSRIAQLVEERDDAIRLLHVHTNLNTQLTNTLLKLHDQQRRIGLKIMELDSEENDSE